MQPINKILTALFDIKPVDDAGRVDLQKIYRIQPVVNLAKSTKKNKNLAFSKVFSVGNKPLFRGLAGSRVQKPPALTRISNYSKLAVKAPYQLNCKKQNPTLLGDFEGSLLGGESQREQFPLPYTSQQKVTDSPVLAELEKYLNADLDVKKEVKSIGGKTEYPIFAWQKSGISTEIPGCLDPAKQRSLSVNAGKLYPRKPKFLISRKSLNLKTEVPNEEKLTKLNVSHTPNVQMPQDDYQAVLSQINQRVVSETDEIFVDELPQIDPISLGILSEVQPVAASAEIESWVQYTKSEAQSQKSEIISKFKNPKLLLRMCELITNIRIGTFIPTRKFLMVATVIGFVALVLTLFGQYGISVKNEIVNESNLAVASLEEASESLKAFDFTAASNNFAQAYEEFSKAGENLNFMGTGVASLFADLPGLDKLTAGGAGKLKPAKNLVEAGKLIAESGKAISEAVGLLSQTSAILKLTTPELTTLDVHGGTSDIQNIISSFKKSLLFSHRNLSKARVFLSEVSPDVLPKDKKETFVEFQLKLPEFQDLISDAVSYADFLEGFLGSNGVKKYLVLFQNSSELRPTGGFPGTYAVVTFKDGKLLGFTVDDVYNLDGQLKENFIPPLPLQHITPTWGMRDSNWFIDFSVSAQKAMEFFNREAGYEVDGVLAINSETVSEILKIVGPIEMPEYDIVINDENFISTVQEEVEYGGNRLQPKKIIMDMAPRLLEKIYSSDQSQWLDIFNVFISGLSNKDILLYFKDLSLENFVAEKGFGGIVKKTDGDYLMVTFSNIKGSKTDQVIDNSVKITTRLEDERAVHKLELTRKHNGGSTRYGFYNKQSPAYVRVLVPDGAELISASGNSSPDFKPLISYAGEGFKRDDDLFKMESSFHLDRESGVSRYRESGKTGFAFWMVTDPGEEKTVELKYSVPFGRFVPGGDYNMYVQKQPGLEVDNFEFQAGDVYIYSGVFDKDLELKVKLE